MPAAYCARRKMDDSHRTRPQASRAISHVALSSSPATSISQLVASAIAAIASVSNSSLAPVAATRAVQGSDLPWTMPWTDSCTCCEYVSVRARWLSLTWYTQAAAVVRALCHAHGAQDILRSVVSTSHLRTTLPRAYGGASGASTTHNNPAVSSRFKADLGQASEHGHSRKQLSMKMEHDHENGAGKGRTGHSTTDARAKSRSGRGSDGLVV